MFNYRYTYRYLKAVINCTTTFIIILRCQRMWNTSEYSNKSKISKSILMRRKSYLRTYARPPLVARDFSMELRPIVLSDHLTSSKIVYYKLFWICLCKLFHILCVCVNRVALSHFTFMRSISNWVLVNKFINTQTNGNEIKTCMYLFSTLNAPEHSCVDRCYSQNATNNIFIYCIFIRAWNKNKF